MNQTETSPRVERISCPKCGRAVVAVDGKTLWHTTRPLGSVLVAVDCK
jgi:hypothetical protein